MLLVVAALLQVAQLPHRELTPDLTLDLTGPAEIQYPAGVVETDRAYFVADPRGGQVLQFDQAGKFVRATGRSGEGPGEYRFPVLLGRRGDTLVVGDPIQHRIILFDGEGRPLRTLTLASGGSGTPVYLRNGRSAQMPNWTSAPRAGPRDPVLGFDGSGRLHDTLFNVEVERGQMRMDLGPERMLIGMPTFSDAPILAVANDGDGFFLVERRTTGEAVVVVKRLGADGAPRWTRRIPFEPRPVDRTVVDSVIRGYTHPATAGASAVPENVVRAALTIPARQLEVLGVSTAPDGSLWLRRPTPAGVGAKYLVLDPAGVPSFEVTLPPGARLAGVTEDAVFLSSFDGDDLPRLVRYRIH